jgi:hypothetical protein
MPSPCNPKGGFYVRKGGAWKQTKNGQMKYVGYGKGPPAPLPGGGYFRPNFLPLSFFISR